MYAVIISGGKQYRVSEGQNLKIEKLPAEVGTTIDFDQVLMVTKDDTVHLGAPIVKNSKVTATVVAHGRGEKIRIVKHRRRKHYHREMGHRQHYTEVKITQIQAG